MAKRISSSSINWTLIAEGVAESQRKSYLAFKSKSDRFLLAVTTKPAELPKIDWSYYKSRITAPGVVDSFQKSYESLKIPFPSDQGVLAEADKLERKTAEAGDAFEKNILAEIQKYKARLNELNAMLPYSKMTLEEYCIARPERSFDPPKLWPQWLKDQEEIDREKESQKVLEEGSPKLEGKK